MLIARAAVSSWSDFHGGPNREHLLVRPLGAAAASPQANNSEPPTRRDVHSPGKPAHRRGKRIVYHVPAPSGIPGRTTRRTPEASRNHPWAPPRRPAAPPRLVSAPRITWGRALDCETENRSPVPAVVEVGAHVPLADSTGLPGPAAPVLSISPRPRARPAGVALRNRAQAVLGPPNAGRRRTWGLEIGFGGTGEPGARAVPGWPKPARKRGRPPGPPFRRDGAPVAAARRHGRQAGWSRHVCVGRIHRAGRVTRRREAAGLVPGSAGLGLGLAWPQTPGPQPHCPTLHPFRGGA